MLSLGSEYNYIYVCTVYFNTMRHAFWIHVTKQSCNFPVSKLHLVGVTASLSDVSHPPALRSTCSTKQGIQQVDIEIWWLHLRLWWYLLWSHSPALFWKRCECNHQIKYGNSNYIICPIFWGKENERERIWNKSLQVQSLLINSDAIPHTYLARSDKAHPSDLVTGIPSWNHYCFFLPCHTWLNPVQFHELFHEFPCLRLSLFPIHIPIQVSL